MASSKLRILSLSHEFVVGRWKMTDIQRLRAALAQFPQVKIFVRLHRHDARRSRHERGVVFHTGANKVRKDPPISPPASLPTLSLDLQLRKIRNANQELFARRTQNSAQAPREFRIK